MKIVFLSSEAAPYAKTGGLADVISALPRALAEAGHEVVVFLPLYRAVREKFPGLTLRLDGRPGSFPVWEDRTGAVPAFFIENDAFFDRDHFYGTAAGDDFDNGERFAFFSRAVLEALRRLDFSPDIIHAHDWQTATAPAFLKFVFRNDPFFRRTKSIFTIHNLAYQGLFDPGVLGRVGLPENLFRPEDLEFFGRVNFLKAGILYADAITTVSPRYAREIQTPEFGCGLDGLLRAKSGGLRGIINGIDDSAWDPKRDPALAAPFGPDDLTGKRKCKRDVLRAFDFSLSPPDLPVVGMVSRLAAQKGFDIFLGALERLAKLDIRIVIVGSGEKKLERGLILALHRYPRMIGLKIGFDDVLARKVYGGSDFFLIPSRYEPCGLTQMYSQRYAAVPIVRAVGGLDDTVEEFKPRTGRGTGFKFTEAEPEALVSAVRRALRAWKNPKARGALRRNGLARDFSWKHPAEDYLGLYRELLG
jgi:starch synthase